MNARSFSSPHDSPAGALRLRGRRILVTGASRGIGRAVSRELVRQGAALALTARDRDRLEDLRAELERAGGLARSVAADARSEQQVNAALAEARAFLGGLDSAVIGHGVNRLAPVESLSTRDWAEVLDTNLTGAFHFARAALPHLAAPGAVVFVSSVTALPGYEKFPGFAAYAASKRGLLGLAEILAVETAPRGLRIYAICPRGVDTEMFRRTFPGARPQLAPSDVAERITELLDPTTAPKSGTVVEV